MEKYEKELRALLAKAGKPHQALKAILTETATRNEAFRSNAEKQSKAILDMTEKYMEAASKRDKKFYNLLGQIEDASFQRCQAQLMHMVTPSSQHLEEIERTTKLIAKLEPERDALQKLMKQKSEEFRESLKIRI